MLDTELRIPDARRSIPLVLASTDWRPHLVGAVSPCSCGSLMSSRRHCGTRSTRAVGWLRSLPPCCFSRIQCSCSTRRIVSTGGARSHRQRFWTTGRAINGPVPRRRFSGPPRTQRRSWRCCRCRQERHRRRRCGRARSWQGCWRRTSMNLTGLRPGGWRVSASGLRRLVFRCPLERLGDERVSPPGSSRCDFRRDAPFVRLALRGGRVLAR